MEHSEYDPAAGPRRTSNSGRIVGATRALKAPQLWAIRFRLDRERRLRDRALFDLAIDSKLRGCDVVKAWIGDLARGERKRRSSTRPREISVPSRFSSVTGRSEARFAIWCRRRGRTHSGRRHGGSAIANCHLPPNESARGNSACGRTSPWHAGAEVSRGREARELPRAVAAVRMSTAERPSRLLRSSPGWSGSGHCLPGAAIHGMGGERSAHYRAPT